MGTTVSELITYAYWKSGIVSPGSADISAAQNEIGLFDLNALIADKTIEDGTIPYYSKYTFNLTAGEQTYFIPNLINTNTATFFVQSVRFSMQKMTRDQYWGSSRAENINSLPASWNLEPCFGGANLNFYFSPDQDYPAQILGQFRLDPVDFNDDLSLIFDPFYINFILYSLSDRVCDTWGYTTPPQVAKRLAYYYNIITNQVGGLDTTLVKSSMLQRKPSYNYAQVNLGRGWSPS